MNNQFFTLFKEIRTHRKLADKRHPMYEGNKYGKGFMLFFGVLMLAYLLLIGVAMPSLFRDIAPSMEPYHIFNKGMWFLLLADFLSRFTFQKNPASEVKPYCLLPVRRRDVLDVHLVLNALNSVNLIWLVLLLPFGCLTLWKYFHLAGIIGFLLGYLILIVANSYWYTICRTLMNEHLLWALLPLGVYGIMGALMFVPKEKNLFWVGMEWGEGFIQWEPLAFLAAIVLLCATFILCRMLQSRIIDKEISRTKVTRLKRVNDYSFLERFGQIGEYMRLELKLLTRNKVPRTQVRTGLVLMIMFSVMLAFTDTYDNDFMRYFIAVYNFSVLGIMVLSQCMMFEGNYLDGLMSRKQNILSLLKAKYYVQCIALLIPMLIMIAPVVQGKLSLLDVFACLFLTSGFVFFIMFQLAVYNKSTMNLNQKVMGRNSSNNWLQTAFIMVCFFLPVFLIMAINAISPNSTISTWTIFAIGLIMTLIHPLWLRNVYNRFMKRRYANMDGFRQSRNN